MEIINKYKYAVSLLKMHYQYIKCFGVRLWVIVFLKIKNEVELNHPILKNPFSIRTNTSDVKEFFEVIMCEEYKINLNIHPINIIDLGGNNGDTASYFASMFPKSKVLVVEPEKSNYKQLVKNTQYYSNVKTIQAAIWFEKARLRIENEDDDKWAFRVKSENKQKTKDISTYLEAVTVEQIMKINGINHIDILKIDIEGAEKELFSRNYEKWLPVTNFIIIELHDRFKKGCRANFETALKKFNFTIQYHSENQAIAINGNTI